MIIINPYIISAGYDSDAQAFFDASGITDTTQKDAVNQLVLDLKSYSLWSKMKAIYPMVGGSASSVKFNLKDPQDTDAAFRLTISGGVTFTNGFLSNGTNGYANTHFTPSSNSTDNDTSIGYKSTTNTSGLYAEFGAFSTYRFAVYNYNSAENVDMYNWQAGQGRAQQNPQVDTSGVFIGSRTASNSLKLYRNGSQIGSTATGLGDSISGIAIKLYLGALNNAGTADFFTPRNLTFAFLGDGLSDTEVSNLTTAINTFDTTLGR